MYYPWCILPRIGIGDKERCLNNIYSKFSDENLVVRSSSFDEDNISTTNAGAFLSILNVSIAELDTAVERVFDSYGVKDLHSQVLIQPMLKEVKKLWCMLFS